MAPTLRPLIELNLVPQFFPVSFASSNSITQISNMHSLLSSHHVQSLSLLSFHISLCKYDQLLDQQCPMSTLHHSKLALIVLLLLTLPELLLGERIARHRHPRLSS